MNLRLLILILTLSLVHPSTVGAQQFVWARQAVTASYAAEPVIDRAGNTYIGGNYLGTALIDGQPLTGSPYSASQQYIYLAKFNAAGNLTRVVGNTGQGHADLIGMCGDHGGHVYLLGAFEETTDFGGISITGDLGIFSYFVAKCDTAGNFLWVRAYNNSFPKGDYDIQLGSITCDEQDNVYIVGNSRGAYSANGISFNNNGSGLFVSRLSPASGMAIWTRLVTGDAYMYPKKIMTDPTNNDVLIAGVYGSSAAPRPGTICIFGGKDSLSLSNALPTNIFIARYNQSGTYKWVHEVGTVGNNEFSSTTCDGGGNIYLSGFLGDTAAGAPGNQFLRKIDPTGQASWTRKSYYYTQCISANAGSVYWVGQQTSDSNVIMKLDTAAGNVTWTTPALDPFVAWGSVVATTKGTVLYSGLSPRFAQHLGKNHLYNNGDGFLFTALLSDTTYTPPGSNRISGTVFRDSTRNCVQDMGESGLKAYAVIAQPGPYYGTADATGNYSIKVPSGNYNVNLLDIRSHQVTDTQSCMPMGYPVNLPGNNTTTGNHDFGLQYRQCWLMKLSVSTSAYGNTYVCSRARKRVYSICNYGLDTASNVELKIKYPGLIITPVRSSIPWTSYNPTDSTLTFTIGTMAPESCLDIEVTDTANCTGYAQQAYQPIPFTGTLTPFNQCYSEDTANNFVRFSERKFLPIGVPPAPEQTDISIFPNPTSGMIYLDYLTGREEIQIYSAFGAKVLEERAQGRKSLNFSLNQVPGGIYFVIIRSNAGTVTKRILKL